MEISASIIINTVRKKRSHKPNEWKWIAQDVNELYRSESHTVTIPSMCYVFCSPFVFLNQHRADRRMSHHSIKYIWQIFSSETKFMSAGCIEWMRRRIFFLYSSFLALFQFVCILKRIDGSEEGRKGIVDGGKLIFCREEEWKQHKKKMMM